MELDISQNDFAKLRSGQRGIVTTDAFPDRKYEGVINEISPEANRQKATVQIKVKMTQPGRFSAARDECQRGVLVRREARRFRGRGRSAAGVVPAAAVRDGAVFVLLDGKAVRRPVKTGPRAPREFASKRD